MRTVALLTALGLWLAPLGLASARAEGKPAPKDKEEVCHGHGTTIDFLDTPSDAARKALKEQKLVFVLHVSGNFEDPRFT